MFTRKPGYSIALPLSMVLVLARWRRPRGGRWWDTDEATREEGPVQASAVALHDDTGRGSRVRLPPAQPSEATDTAAPQLCPAHAKRRSTSRLALCIKVDQKCGRSASEEVAANFIAGRFPETAMLRALCAHALHFHLTPCLRAVGKTLGQDRRFCSASIAALRRRCLVFSSAANWILMAFGANSRGLNPGSFRRPLLPGRLARTRVSCLPHETDQGRMKIAGSMLYHGRYGPASRSTEIWTFLEDDVRCAAWFNSGYTLTRQSTFPPAVTCSAFAPRSSRCLSPEKYRNLNTLGDDFRSGFRILGSTADTRAHASVYGFGENCTFSHVKVYLGSRG